MKKNIFIVSAIACLVYSFISGCSVTGQTPQSQIIGTWKSNSDSLLTITFASNGQRKDYYEGVLTDTYTYALSNTCGTNTSNSLYLMTVISQNEVSCDIFNGISTDAAGIKTMSITTEGGKLTLYTKQ